MTVLGDMLVPPSGDELDRYLLGQLTEEERQALELRLDLYPETRKRLAEIERQRQLMSGAMPTTSVAWGDPHAEPVADLIAVGHEARPTEADRQERAEMHRRAREEQAMNADMTIGQSQSGTREPFELVRHLGTGGFAHTYLATVVDPGYVKQYGTNEVALKFPIGRENSLILEKEIHYNVALHLRLGEMESTHLVRYLGFTVFRNSVVMVMEYVPGGSLRQRIGDIGSQTSLAIDEAVDIIRGTLRGLAYIHQQQIYHRDVKPANILMKDNIAKVADLGLARLQTPEKQASTKAGSMFYMSPESWVNRDLSPRVDVWSAGVVLYEMLTGRLPFGDMTTPFGSLMGLISDSPHTCASEMRREVPRGLSDIIDKALSKKPDDRYADAQEMLDAVDSFMQSSGSAMHSFMDEMARIQGTMFSSEGNGDVETRLRDLQSRYPEAPEACQHLGEFYNRSARYREAIGVFTAGIARHPESAILHWDLALALLGREERGDAAEHIKRAMALGLEESLMRYAETLLRSLSRTDD